MPVGLFKCGNQTNAPGSSLRRARDIPARVARRPDSHEDIRTVVQDLQRFPSAYALPSQWPTNPWQGEAAAHTLERMLTSFRDRVLVPVHAQSATKVLLAHALPRQLPAALNNSFRMLAMKVMELLGIPSPEDRWIPIAKQAA